MSGFYTEADYENSIIELFQNMGYRYVYGPDVERDFSSPLYEVELNDALHRLNPTMPEDAIADALFKLKNFENAELVQKNAVFMDYPGPPPRRPGSTALSRRPTPGSRGTTPCPSD